LSTMQQDMDCHPSKRYFPMDKAFSNHARNLKARELRKKEREAIFIESQRCDLLPIPDREIPDLDLDQWAMIVARNRKVVDTAGEGARPKGKWTYGKKPKPLREGKDPWEALERG
jgi:hypothetical protein